MDKLTIQHNFQCIVLNAPLLTQYQSTLGERKGGCQRGKVNIGIMLGQTMMGTREILFCLRAFFSICTWAFTSSKRSHTYLVNSTLAYYMPSPPTPGQILLEDGRSIACWGQLLGFQPHLA